MSSPSDIHFELHHKIEETRPKKNGSGDIDKCIYYCEKGMDNLQAFIDMWKEDFGEADLIPPTIYCRDQLIRCYLIQGKYEKALDTSERSFTYGAWTEEEALSSKTHIQQVRNVHQVILERLKEYPGTLQADFYKIFPDLDKNAMKWFFANSSSLIKRKSKNTYTLWLPGQKIPNEESEAKDIVSKDNHEITNNSQALIDMKQFPDWYVSISFGQSTSKNYSKALMLAKQAPQYIESQDEFGNLIHQAVYSSAPKEYLAFISLYELVSSWKSAFVIINGEIIDRKIVGGLNYCYGDKIRSGKSDFCYGASVFTENPFGCHRLQISAANNPWWSFGKFDEHGIWQVDKEAIKQRIMEYSIPYASCPAFSYEKVFEGLNSIPDFIDPRKSENWVATDISVTPKEIAYEKQVNRNVVLKLGDSSKPKKNASGCLSTVLSLGCIFSVLTFLLF